MTAIEELRPPKVLVCSELVSVAEPLLEVLGQLILIKAHDAVQSVCVHLDVFGRPALLLGQETEEAFKGGCFALCDALFEVGKELSLQREHLVDIVCPFLQP